MHKTIIILSREGNYITDLKYHISFSEQEFNEN
jgi:hypothetical protein